jgi:thioester reductase-like protein
VETVVHLAANPAPDAPWSDLLPLNVVGTYNVLAAARQAGCRRVVLASSVHAVTGYAHDVQVRTDDPVNPGTLYGVTKCFGEALGRYFAEQEGLSVIAVRIGHFMPPDAMAEADHAQALDLFVSPDDLNRVVDACVETSAQWAIVHAVSDNAFKRLDMSGTRALLGAVARDDAAALSPAVPSDLRVREQQSVSDGVPSGVEPGQRPQ